MTEPLPDEVDDALWAEACRRAAAIRRFLESSSSESTVADLASELQVSQATTYRLLRRFRTDGTVMSLVETKRGRPTGHRALDARREEIIEKAIRTYFLKPTRPTVSQLVRDIETDCAAAGLKPPHRRTIERRLDDLDL
ncbi:MAG: helix-turn-helix domain-containing protein, partial [Pseudomonadota bacterium]